MKRTLSIAIVILGICLLIAFITLLKMPHLSETKSNIKLSSQHLNLQKLFSEASNLEKKGDLLKARELLKKALSSTSQAKDIKAIQRRVERLNIKIIFSPIVDRDSFLYEVKPGDSLAKIAKRFNTTISLIKRSNRLKTNLIRPGEKLKIVKGIFSLVIDKSQNILFLKENGEIIKTYTVSTGKNNCTPTGAFKITNKLKNPVWFRKDIGAVVPPSSPDNVLGSRWLGLDIEGYGIHGTTKPEDLGKQVTAGCVRMRNSDIEELYDILPLKTKVVIMD